MSVGFGGRADEAAQVFASLDARFEASFEAVLREALGGSQGHALAGESPAKRQVGAAQGLVAMPNGEALPTVANAVVSPPFSWGPSAGSTVADMAWNLTPSQPERVLSAEPAGSRGAAIEGGHGGPYRGLIETLSQRHGVPAWLVTNVMRAESAGNPMATSPAGAQGLMQLMPQTAAELGVSDPYDPAQNLEGGVKYLARMIGMFEGDLVRAVAAYNAGPGSVQRFGGVPPFPETQRYVARVLGT
ncbi:MAG: lytic transglycosylase domain-containing protein [Candidatus Sericytochromatia bacterium]|nr:lytic transglycosylase domain-containing protein [Candidatus Sericytochromatia bacterium]